MTIVRDARTALGLTQSALADAAGVSQSMVAAIEAGRRVPSPAVAARLAEVLGITLDDIYGKAGR